MRRLGSISRENRKRTLMHPYGICRLAAPSGKTVFCSGSPSFLLPILPVETPGLESDRPQAVLTHVCETSLDTGL